VSLRSPRRLIDSARPLGQAGPRRETKFKSLPVAGLGRVSIKEPGEVRGATAAFTEDRAGALIATVPAHLFGQAYTAMRKSKNRAIIKPARIG
jgi:hypothetical protein